MTKIDRQTQAGFQEIVHKMASVQCFSCLHMQYKSSLKWLLPPTVVLLQINNTVQSTPL